MVFTRSKINELSKEELIEEVLSFDNLSEKRNDLTKEMDNFATNLILLFLSYRFPKSTIHYYTNKLLIWSGHSWIILNI